MIRWLLEPFAIVKDDRASSENWSIDLTGASLRLLAPPALVAR